MSFSPIIFQSLAIGASGCLLVALVIGREQLRRDLGLKRGILGLLTSAVTAVALAFNPPHLIVWPLIVVMTGGLLAVIINVRLKPAVR